MINIEQEDNKRKQERRQMERRILELEAENQILRSNIDQRQGERRIGLYDGTQIYTSIRMWGALIFALCVIAFLGAHFYESFALNVLGIGPYSEEVQLSIKILHYSGVGSMLSAAWGVMGAILLFLKKSKNKKLIEYEQKKYK